MGYGDGETHKKIEIRFIDSCRFMGSSLEKLASNLIGRNTAGMKCRQCADTCLEFQSIDPEYMASFWCKASDSNTTKQLDMEQVKTNTPAMARFISGDDFFRLMFRKGVYPYEYMDSWRRFKETDLPPKEAFYSKLNMKGISDNDYEHTKTVWNFIAQKGAEVNMGDYHDMYLVTDVLLLADSRAFEDAPGLAWKAALKYTEIKLELLTDPDMLLMFEKGIRGGITQAVHIYAKANNKYMEDQYDPEAESSYLQYLDANNLYGWAMRQDLLTHGFKWLSNVETFTEKHISKLVADNKHGYILEVDIDYPNSLHDKHNELPFLPERKMVHRAEKLIPNLEHKRKYVVQIRALHQALKHGLELKKVYRVIQFNQKPWLRDYIDHKTGLQTAAKNEFEKDFYKLINLSVFGKTMENLRNHHNIQLVTNEEKYTKLVMKPNFKGGNYFSSHFMGVEMCKTEVKMNKPVRFYRDIADDVETRFDTSAYGKDDNKPLPIGKNKKVVGFMKNKLSDKIMTEFITLRAKLYAYKSLTKEGGDRKAKGVKKCFMKKFITFEDCQRCLENGVDIYKTWVCIQNKGHQIHTQEVNKLALNRADDKRIVQPDQITTLARGHYRLVANK
ncbi:uncharacterized protein LOC130614489 [Hydractinia symbiolongicarpus]|uniref:uncharacterized protein LOC130614489 n=1 Tax=Hydractinia symbiolongicarpus TaxID=13093 RepID=UPI00254FCC34|nr:uncharacterized protein LOC130614489 [Hydractinia symbiolongicarpus]